MGYSTTSVFGLGIKIPLTTFIEKLNELNIKNFTTICEDGYFDEIDIKNKFDSFFQEYYNQSFYQTIKKKSKFIVTLESIEGFKKKMKEMIKEKGFEDKMILYTSHHIMSTNTWGMVEGTIGTYKDISFDMEKISKEIHQKYQWLGEENYKIVMTLEQRSS